MGYDRGGLTIRSPSFFEIKGAAHGSGVQIAHAASAPMRTVLMGFHPAPPFPLAVGAFPLEVLSRLLPRLDDGGFFYTVIPFRAVSTVLRVSPSKSSSSIFMMASCRNCSAVFP